MTRSVLDCPPVHSLSVTQAVNALVSGPISAVPSRVHVATPEQAPSTTTSGTANKPRTTLMVSEVYGGGLKLRGLQKAVASAQ